MGSGESKPGDVGEHASTQRGQMQMEEPATGWMGLASDLRQQMVGIHTEKRGENSALSKKVSELYVTISQYFLMFPGGLATVSRFHSARIGMHRVFWDDARYTILIGALFPDPGVSL